MADKNNKRLIHRGRLNQLPIYFGKLIRSFIYQSDWKMLPMSAVVAFLVSMVIRKGFCLDMEGTLKGSFCLTCVGIWNGCFNSIQSICRERDIVKREHRSGLHISAYVLSHLIYQALICLGQTVITIVVLDRSGVQLPKEGLILSHGYLDFGLTLFLITFASDMLSLLVSAVVHTTTAAMTVMPFLLIFQLAFSGGFFTLPEWATHVSPITISNPGMTAIASLSDYNEKPMSMAWSTLNHIQDDEIEGDISVGQLLELITNVSENALTQNEELKELPDLLREFSEDEEIRAMMVHYNFTPRNIIDSFGQENVKTAVDAVASASARNPLYERDAAAVAEVWLKLTAYALAYAFVAMIALEFIDKDKR